LMVGCDSRPVSPKPPATKDTLPAGPAGPDASPTSGTVPTVPTPASHPSSSAQSMQIGPLNFKIPSGWISQKPGNEMRLGELRVVDKPEDAADLTKGCLVTFTRLGGSVEMNIERWKSQVIDADGKPSRAIADKFDTAGVTVHTVEMTGNYQDGMPGGSKTPRPDWTFRGAVIETPERYTFLRMTGPADAMASQKAGWDELLRTFTVGT